MTPTKALQALVELGIDSRAAGYKLDAAQKDGTANVTDGLVIRYAYGDFEIIDNRLTKEDLIKLYAILEDVLLGQRSGEATVLRIYDKVGGLLGYGPN